MNTSPAAADDPTASPPSPVQAPPRQTSASSHAQSIPKVPQFPPHNAPRVWFITDGLSPIAITLSRYLLEHGDYVVAGVMPSEVTQERGGELREFWPEVEHEGVGHWAATERKEGEKSNGKESEKDNGRGSEEDTENGDRAGSMGRTMKRWKDRFRVVGLDGRVVGQCQSAIAEAIQDFQRIDVLLICKSSTLIGSIEELSQSAHALSLVRDQFEENFFGPVNIIKAALPHMREMKNGHIIVLTGITAHLGTPGLGVYCSSQWAIEGYCDSLAYEIAPFNVKMTIIQPNLEINVLTNKIVTVPPMPEYAADVNSAPLVREILNGLLDRLDSVPLSSIDQTPAAASTTSPINAPTADTPISPGATGILGDAENVSTRGELLSASSVTEVYPKLEPGLKSALIAETVFAIAAIGGHDNPPARHIVGVEGVLSVKEKLKTVSEELEDFIEVSFGVDITK